MGIRLIQISVIYFAIGVSLGMYMSIAHDYALTGVHAHINLLGWASFALVRIVYLLFLKFLKTSMQNCIFGVVILVFH